MLFSASSFGIIGGADGPTSIFLTSGAPEWLNTTGLALVLLLLVPNLIFALKDKNASEKCTSGVMLLLEQLGRYGCMFFLVFRTGLLEFGYPGMSAYLLNALGNLVLIVSYWLVWFLYSRNRTRRRKLWLAVLPCGLFLLNGVCQTNVLLIVFSLLFTAGHLYVTRCNLEES